MKLINPTDYELNVAFAEHVTKWKKSHVMFVGDFWHTDEKVAGIDGDLPPFADSADAVLPWLEKFQHVPINYLSGRKWERDQWEVRIFQAAHEGGFVGHATTLPRACVIALLRAHGVEIEITAPPAHPPTHSPAAPAIVRGP